MITCSRGCYTGAIYPLYLGVYLGVYLGGVWGSNTGIYSTSTRRFVKSLAKHLHRKHASYKYPVVRLL